MSSRKAVDQGSQARSRASFERIIGAAQTLLDGRDWKMVTVEDLCLAAEVSPSSFYRRFRSKDDLLDVVHARYLEHRSAVLGEFVDGFPWAEFPARQVCEMVALAYIEDRLEAESRAFSIMRVQATYPRLAAKAVKSDEVDLAKFAAPLAEITGCEFDNVRFGLVVISSTVIAALQASRPFLSILGWTKEDLVARCVLAFAAITRIEFEPDGSVRHLDSAG